MKPSHIAQRAADLLLGSDAHQRVRAAHSLLALGVIGVFALVQQAGAVLGLLDHAPSVWPAAFSVGAGVLCHAVIRSNWNLVLAPREPSLALPQLLAATTGLAWAHAVGGPARGVLLAPLVLLLVLAGLLPLRPRVALAVGAYACTLLAAAMGWRVARHHDPLRLEIAHALVAAASLGAATFIALRLADLRRRLTLQQRELAAALVSNRQLASRDPLTDLLNRRALLELLRQPAPRQRRGRNALAVLDLDFFKRINDGHGRGVGDQVLRRFADAARRQFRSSDLLARWGGEEFLLVMHDASVEQAAMVLNRLRGRVAAAGFETLAPGLEVSFSAGVAAWADGDDLDAVIDRADRALQRAKDAGRGRVVCWAGAAPAPAAAVSA